MSETKAKLTINSDRVVKDIYESINLLEGVKPEIVDSNGNTNLKLETDLAVNPTCYTMLTDNQDHGKHIDIYAKAADLTYDMGSVYHIDRVSIYGFVSLFDMDFGLEEFEVYFSNERDTLYFPGNCIVHHNNAGNYVPSHDESYRTGADFVIDLENCNARYFGLRILSANPVDDIIRLSCIGVYCDDITSGRQTFFKSVGASAAYRQEISLLSGEVLEGDLTYINDCIGNDSERAVTLSSADGICLSLSMDGTKPISYLSVFADKFPMEMYVSEFSENLFDGCNKCDFVEENKGTYALLTPKASAKGCYVGLVYEADSVKISEIGVHALTTEFIADTEDVICDDFYGVGVNCVPVALMPETRSLGCDESFWELEKRRIINCRPTVVRLWFQLDWFIESGENYVYGIYNFDSEKMQCVYKYLDAFLEAGSEIELNYGWKISDEAQKWYSFPCDKPAGSAPVNLISFSKSCCDLIKELWSRGYSNIKYLTFFNEPQNGDDFRGPFADTEERAHYFRVMLDFVDWQLKREGMRDKIKIWGPEDGWTKKEIELTDSIEGEEGSPIDALTVHRYRIGYNEASILYPKLLKSAKGRKPYLVTETGFSEYGTCWESNMFTSVIAAVDFGMCGVLNWLLADVYYTDPLRFIDPWANNFWAVCCPDTVKKVYGTYYFMSMLTRYIPAHSKAIKLKYNSKDMRAAAFLTPEGDVTVMLTAKNGFGPRKVSVDFGKEIGKTFYRHSMKLPTHFTYLKEREDAHAIIPPCDGEIYASSTLCDDISEEYSCIVYTTIRPYAQVVVGEGYYELKAGESLQLTASVIDGEVPDFKWEITTSVGSAGIVDNNGIYTAAEDAKSGDTVAIKAQPANMKSYGIAVVRIK